MCGPVNKHNRTAALSIRWGLFAFALLLVAGFAFTYFQQQRSIDAAQARIDELNATLDELQLTAAAMQSDLDFAQTDAYIDALLAAREAPEKPARRRAFILKDVRVFLNTLNHSLELMKQGGIAAGMKREETEEELIVTISIPKK